MSLFDFFHRGPARGPRRSVAAYLCWIAGDLYRTRTSYDCSYKRMNEWVNAMYVTKGVVVDGRLIAADLVKINLGIRILLETSYSRRLGRLDVLVKPRPALGRPFDRKHPWNQTTLPKPQKARTFKGKYTWVMSPHWYDEQTKAYLAARYRWRSVPSSGATALAIKVDLGCDRERPVKVSRFTSPKKTTSMRKVEFSGRSPS